MARHGSIYTRLISSAEWRRFRDQVIREQPLCQWCMARHGWTVASQVVHHLIECESATTEAGIRELMFRRSNCVALCRQCHNEYHNGQGYHSTQKVKERQAERQAAWQDAMARRFNGPPDEG